MHKISQECGVSFAVPCFWTPCFLPKLPMGYGVGAQDFVSVDLYGRKELHLYWCKVGG